MSTKEVPETIELYASQPQDVIYNDTRAPIDWHNQCRQDDLILDFKLGTMDWSRRDIITVFGMRTVDIWIACNGCRGEERTGTHGNIFIALAEKLIDNTNDGSGRRRGPRNALDRDALINGVLLGGIDPYLPLTKRERENGVRELQTCGLQGRCQVCKNKTTMVCTVCREKRSQSEVHCMPPSLVPSASSHTWPTSTRCSNQLTRRFRLT